MNTGRIRLTLGSVIALIAIAAVACGGDDGASTSEVRDIVRAELAAAAAAAPAPAPAPAGPTSAEISALVEKAVTGAVPAGTSPEEIRALVEAAVAAASTPAVSATEIEQLVGKAVAAVAAKAPTPLTAAEVQAVVQAAVQAIPPPQPVVVVATPVPTTAGEKVFTLSFGEDLPNFMPHTSVTVTQTWIHDLVFSRLLMPDPENGKWAPDLAERWEIAPDGTSYTFFLRKNALWHDGQPVTARDVAFTFKSYLTPDTTSKNIGALTVIKGAQDYIDGNTSEVAGIVVVDDYTIRFDQEFPNGLFLINSSGQSRFAILPEHILGDVPPKELIQHDYFTKDLVGSGAFKFVKFLPGQFIEIEANPDYFFGRPVIDRIIFRSILSIDVAQVAMQRGEVDFIIATGGTLPTTETFEAAIRDPRLRVVGTKGFRIHSYAFSSKAEDLRDPRIRQAFLYALDREKLITAFRAGNGTVVNSFMTHGWYQKPEWNQLYPFDPDKARALLEEAGWDPDREVVVKLITLKSEELRAQRAAEQQMLADVGF
ncbi:MAG: ABC transporter substrate-binding protein, partial [Chloroflexi bacterium]|nr:ABC transporter substrate-binding protein [Chloroflexota bacterium]